MDKLAAACAAQLRVTGVVQGVGFRPFVWRLARQLALAGWVRNDAAGVLIHAEGSPQAVAELARRLVTQAPPLARVDGVSRCALACTGVSGFAILDSQGGLVRTSIGADSAPCVDCLAELFDPAGRRWRHGFITCTHCGPRYTVTRRLPYDRPQTSLAPFPLCPTCQREYTDPADRRFHAETTCCPDCGPQLSLWDSQGQPLPGDAIAATLGRLLAGDIVAVKGLGGFHLMCDAANAQAVARLRQRKQREEKPFAVLLPHLDAARRYALLDDSAASLLCGAQRPVLLLDKLPGIDAQLPGVAPGLAHIGIMLPSTPLQYLLFHEAAGRPPGTDWLAEGRAADYPCPVLVATSANPGGEPLVIDNAEAVTRLAGIADAFLVHDRDIVVRCDDSVVRSTGPEPDQCAAVGQFLRRARGYTPQAIKLARSGPSVLALGGWFKNTICVTRGAEAFVSQHIGDLDSAAGCVFFEETVSHLLDILDVQPQRVAHDLHPDFFSSRFAQAFAHERGLPALAVQHHHAHIGAVLAEQGWGDAPVLGLALDGLGLGSDGGIWGGELLRVEGGRCARIGHLAPLLLPGGDRAAREPWRMAASVLHGLGRGGEIAQRFADQPGAGTLAAMLQRGFNSPATSSLGRAFDAAAGLLGLRRVAAFEGQAAMLLEGRAALHGPVPPLARGWRLEQGVLDLAPLFALLADCHQVDYGAALFHATLAAALEDWVTTAALAQGVQVLACGGGCFLNRILSQDLAARLTARGLRLLTARQLPPNDGGLSLGQAWVAQSMEFSGQE